MAARRGAETRGTARVVVTADAANRLDAARRWLAGFPDDAELLVVAPAWDAAAAVTPSSPASGSGSGSTKG